MYSGASAGSGYQLSPEPPQSGQAPEVSAIAALLVFGENRF